MGGQRVSKGLLSEAIRLHAGETLGRGRAARVWGRGESLANTPGPSPPASFAKDSFPRGKAPSERARGRAIGRSPEGPLVRLSLRLSLSLSLRTYLITIVLASLTVSNLFSPSGQSLQPKPAAQKQFTFQVKISYFPTRVFLLSLAAPTD